MPRNPVQDPAMEEVVRALSSAVCVDPMRGARCFDIELERQQVRDQIECFDDQ
jgi:hypothetical protein